MPVLLLIVRLLQPCSSSSTSAKSHCELWPSRWHIPFHSFHMSRSCCRFTRASHRGPFFRLDLRHSLRLSMPGQDNESRLIYIARHPFLDVLQHYQHPLAISRKPIRLAMPILLSHLSFSILIQLEEASLYHIVLPSSCCRMPLNILNIIVQAFPKTVLPTKLADHRRCELLSRIIA